MLLAAAAPPPALVRIAGPELRETFADPKALHDGVSLLGFSKDGKIALVLEPADEACGCYLARVFVQDLRTDKIVFTEDVHGFPGKPKDPHDLASLWVLRGAAWSAKLAELGIDLAAHPALAATAGTAEDPITFAVQPENKPETAEMPGLSSQAIRVRRAAGAKTVHTDRWNDDAPSPLETRILGCLKSPFEERIAIVYAEKWPGYEGPPNVIRVKVTGATLGSGFKKPE